MCGWSCEEVWQKISYVYAGVYACESASTPHRCTRVCTHTHTDTITQTHVQSERTPACTHTHAHTLTHTHSQTRTHTRALACACTRVCTHSLAHTLTNSKQKERILCSYQFSQDCINNTMRYQLTVCAIIALGFQGMLISSVYTVQILITAQLYISLQLYISAVYIRL